MRHQCLVPPLRPITDGMRCTSHDRQPTHCNAGDCVHNTNPAALPLSSGRPPPREAYPIVPSPPASG
ncbi:hypothetical protein BD779DRAFT_1547156 [Infundibulicybe gibba]|nr:hypothetical protein BD779DRAFT_1547133 [Infundibulicybe gibba]KAF8881121.1 hypothetical protein BD779DRAFT_1547156 [Infundibulicybe gibba]